MEINAAEFRTKCFKILEQVKTTHIEVIITKWGKSICRRTLQLIHAIFQAIFTKIPPTESLLPPQESTISPY